MIKRSNKGIYSVKGTEIKCLICEHPYFEKTEAQLNTAGMTFLGLDWANKTADVLCCKKCGYLHWFKS